MQKFKITIKEIQVDVESDDTKKFDAITKGLDIVKNLIPILTNGIKEDEQTHSDTDKKVGDTDTTNNVVRKKKLTKRKRASVLNEETEGDTANTSSTSSSTSSFPS
jgi:hypothetical protein